MDIMLLRFSLLLCLLIINVAQAADGWGSYWPLSGMTAIPTTSTYSNYMEDLYYASDERARATLSGTNTTPELVRDGSVLKYSLVPGPKYDVPQIKWAPAVPWFDGITNAAPTYTVVGTAGLFDDLCIQSGVSQRFVHTSITLTNGTWITNTAVAVIPTDAGAITSVVKSAVTYVSSECSTNILYDAWKTNKVPRLSYIVTGAAFDVLRSGQYTTHDGQHWGQPGSESVYPWHYTEELDPVYTLQPEGTLDYPIYGRVGSQIMSVTNVTIPYYLANTNRSFDVVDVNVTITNYDFVYSNAVVAMEPIYLRTTPASVAHVIAPDTSVTVTSTYKIVENAFWYGSDTLLASIMAQIGLCAPRYLANIYADNTGSYQSYLETTMVWKWLSPSNWVYEPYGALYGPYDGTNRTYTQSLPLPCWDMTNLLQSTGAGTNVYRLDILVNSLVYPSLTGGSYRPQAGPIVRTVPGWVMGSNYNQTVSQSLDMCVVTNGNPQFICYPKSSMNVTLASFKCVPMHEKTLKAEGFSPVYWAPITNAATPTSLTNVQFQAVRQAVITNYYWLQAMNDTTLTCHTNEPGQPSIYYTAASAYVFPLMTASGPAGWFIATNKAFGTDMSLNWATIIGSDLAEANQVLRQMGYPTRVTPYYIGYKSIGASGYYYPGGVLRPDTYTVGVMSNLGSRVYSTANQGLYYDQDLLEFVLGWERDNGGVSAYPYLLEYMAYDDLCNWPNASINVRKATTNTTQIPSFNLSIVGDALQADANRSLYGYATDELIDESFYRQTNELIVADTAAITAPGAISTHPLIGCITRTVTNNPNQQLTWERDAVWNCTSSTVTDVYYIAGISRVITNRIPTNPAVTRIDYVVASIPTSKTITVDLSKSAANTQIDIVISNEVALYSSSAGMLNPTSLDACYKAINALKVLPAQCWIDYTEYGAITNNWGSEYIDYYFGKASVHYEITETRTPDSDDVARFGVYGFTNYFTNNIPKTHDDVIPQTSTVKKYGAVPEWSVYNDSWYTEGNKWPTYWVGSSYPYWMAVDDAESALVTHNVVRSTIMGDVIIGTVTKSRTVDNRQQIAFRDVIPSYSNSVDPSGLTMFNAAPIAKWASNVAIAITNSTNFNNTADLYIGFSYTGGSITGTEHKTTGYLYSTWYEGLNDNIGPDLNMSIRAEMVRQQLAYNNTTYAPVTAISTNNVVKLVRSVTLGASTVYTDLYDYAQQPLQLDTVELFSASGTMTLGSQGNDSYDYKAIGYKPYSYKLRTIQAARKPEFKYHD